MSDISRGAPGKPFRRIERITQIREGTFRPTAAESDPGTQRSQFVAGPLEDRSTYPARKPRPIYHRETGGELPGFGYDTTELHIYETIFWAYFIIAIVVIVVCLTFSLPEGNMKVYEDLNKSNWVIPPWALPVGWFFFYMLLAHAALRSAAVSGIKQIDIIPGIELRGFTIVAFIAILILQILWTYAIFDAVTPWPAFYFALLILVIAVFWLAIIWTDDRQTSISLLLFVVWAAYITMVSFNLATLNPAGTKIDNNDES